MEFRKFFPEHLRQLRKAQGETQAAVAQAIGVSPRYYQNLELGENLPGLELCITLADHFGVSLDYLTGRTNER